MALTPRACRRSLLWLLLAGPFGSSAADGAFTHAELREVPALSQSASDDLLEPAKVYHLVAVFDGPGVAGPLGTPGIENNVVVVEADFGLRDADASFYQAPPPFAGDGPPDRSNSIFSPYITHDTYASLGVYNAADGVTNTRFASDWIAAGFSPDWVEGSWFTALPPVAGGDLGAANQFGEVFLGQFTVLGLDAANRGIDETPETITDIETDVFAGRIRIFTQQRDGGASVQVVNLIPAPSSILAPAAFALAGVGRWRRRER